MKAIILAAGTEPTLYTVADAKKENAVAYRAYMWDGISGIRPIVPLIERQEE